MSRKQAREFRQAIDRAAAAVTDDDDRIGISALYLDWAAGKYAVGDVRNNGGQTWECYAAHDNREHPDIVPGSQAWQTFWRPLHGRTPETARPFVQPTNAMDSYKTGEYMIWTDGSLYRCIRQTSYPPDQDAGAWETA